MHTETWDLILRNRVLFSKEEFGLLSKWNARCSLVRNFHEVNFAGLSENASEGYLCAFKLGLTYSAIELLEVALATGPNTRVLNADVSSAINNGYFAKLINEINTHTPKDKKVFTYQVDNKGKSIGYSSNLRDFVYLTRNLVFHGAFTPSGSGLATSQKRRDLIFSLIDSCFDAMDLCLVSVIQNRKSKIFKKASLNK